MAKNVKKIINEKFAKMQWKKLEKLILIKMNEKSKKINELKVLKYAMIFFFKLIDAKLKKKWMKTLKKSMNGKFLEFNFFF